MAITSGMWREVMCESFLICPSKTFHTILCAVSFFLGLLNAEELRDNCRALENCGATRPEIFNLLLAVDRLVDGKPQFLNDSRT